LPETKSPNAGPLFRASENFVARRGVDFVAFGDEGVISDAAVARHRVYRRGAYVVEERILREAGRSEAMMCVGVNEVMVKDSLRSGQQSLINCLTRPVEFPASAPPLDSAKWRNSLLVCKTMSRREL
jgi:hypothetical protein